MGTVNINLAEAQNLNLPLGLQLENEVTEVVFDFSAWQTAYGSGDLGLSIQRPGDSQPYAGELTIDGTDATWTVSSLDIAYKGVGEIQLTYTVGTVVKKSVIYKFTVYKSLGANGEYPSPGQTWQEEIEADIADVKQDLNYITNTVLDKYTVTSDIFTEGKSLLSNGSITDNTHRSVTGYIFCPKGSYIDVDDGYRFNIAEYSGLTASTMIKYTSFRTERYIITSDCYIKFTVASIDDVADVGSILAASKFIGYIVKSSKLVDAENEHYILDLSNINIEYGTINSTTGSNDSASNRVRSTAPIYLKKGTVVTNNSGVKIAWRRYLDEEMTTYEKGSSDWIIGNVTIPLNGYYRFVFQQNNWSNGNLSMLVSLSDNTVGYYGEEISFLKEQTNPYKGYPILFQPPMPYTYNGANIPLDIVDGSGNLLTTLYDWYDALLEEYPDYITESILGTDQSGTYDLKSYTIQSYPATVKPKILWISGIHASEPYTHTVTYMMVKELLENHESDPVLNFIWSNCKLVVIPVANPWGLANGGVRYNSRNVNLNRNFDADWVYDDTQYDNSGSAPNSEAETQILCNFINNNMDAVFTITKHDSDTFASQSNKIGYDISSFDIDRMVFRSLWSMLDSDIKKNYPWILENVPTAKASNLFRNLSTSDRKGTLDKWMNTMGMHGGLYEVSRPANNDFTSSHKQDFLKIGLETSVNIVSSVIVQNQIIQKSNKLQYRYSQILSGE